MNNVMWSDAEPDRIVDIYPAKELVEEIEELMNGEPYILEVLVISEESEPRIRTHLSARSNQIDIDRMDALLRKYNSEDRDVYPCK